MTALKYIEVQGPAEAAALWLDEGDYRIVEVSGTNGCDFKNGTAESYLVAVEEDHYSFTDGENLVRWLSSLTQ
jgi:hypothetical protein